MERRRILGSGVIEMEKEWKLVKEITVESETRNVIVSDLQELDELFIIQNVSCGESTMQQENVYVNNKPNIGNMPIIKNIGYFGWATIFITNVVGYRKVETVYCDLTVPTAGAINISLPYSNVDKIYTLPQIIPSEKITSLKLECSKETVKFAVGSLFKIYGR